MKIFEGDNEGNSIIQLIGMGLILFGILLFITYFIVRLYAIYRGGGAEFYGVNLFMPDNILTIIAISCIMIISGFIITIFAPSKKEEEKDEIDKKIDEMEKEIIEYRKK